MRTTRVATIVAFVFASLVFLYTSRRNTHANDVRKTSSRSRGVFSFQTPLSLFPPNAIISLTDDNTTSFLARPAAFGPLLPTRGLSGQLWIGSGFGDESPRLGTIIAGAEGELGCSDVPGWNNDHTKPHLIKAGSKAVAQHLVAEKKNSKRGTDKMDTDQIIDSVPEAAEAPKHFDDGTDDYLHEASTNRAMPKGNRQMVNSKHADIQSIQEGAEIAGKVVLLSRGGCGFLEKVNWVQRRGGVALIVGDDTRGGPLIQMYARGDTTNVTIPSIFTSYTTAHLLSSLIPTGSYIEDTIDDSGNVAVKVQQPKHVKNPKPAPAQSKKPKKTSSTRERTLDIRNGWFSWFSRSVSDTATKRKEWIMVTEYNEADDIVKGNPKANIALGSTKPGRPSPGLVTDDGFVIGVQDWRDPDLVNTKSRGEIDEESAKEGGSKKPLTDTSPPSTLSEGRQAADDTANSGLRSRIFGDDEDESEMSVDAESSAERMPDEVYVNDHEGLWVTLTPTSAATPFFDTLLVLVVSPLITLTLVYAMLLLRSRIRRRRWRAPKSIVEQLPVHTYHTIQSSSPQTRLPSPTSSSPATPLLQSTSRPRPRSRTTSGLPEPGVMPRQGNDLYQPNKHVKHEHEKTPGMSEWKKYMNKQVECVVCLEDYIDGVSRVMSLPCGHEFHVDCITPWLITRRRTCPICKGDVVRSLKRTSPRPMSRSVTPAERISSPHFDRYHDENNDADILDLGSIHSNDIQVRIVDTAPVDLEEINHDLETGIMAPTPRRARHRGGGTWRNLFGSSTTEDGEVSGREGVDRTR